MNNTGILNKTIEGKTNYTNAQAEDQAQLDFMKDNISDQVGEERDASEGIKAARDKEIMQSKTENTKVEDAYGNSIVVPAGFYITEDAASVPKGIVITDGTNEFVWIPVVDANNMYTEDSATLTTETSVITTYYSKIRIRNGELYTAATIPGHPLNSTRGTREPDLVTGSGTEYDADTTNKYYEQAGFTGITVMAQAFVDDYKNMINSVNIYHGFYVGRYELTGTVDSPTDKAGTTLVNTNWYKLYTACRKITGENDAKKQSTMIWGCQWDEIMNWLVSSGAKTSDDVNTDSSSWGNYYGTSVKASDGITEIKASGTSSVLQTGVTTFTKANNIYDIAGNCIEWTQEACGKKYRATRGNSYLNSSSDPAVSLRGNGSPNVGNSSVSSRPVLYIK